MKTMLLAAAAALTLGSASAAFASDSGDLSATTQFTQYEAGQPVQHSATPTPQAAGTSAIYASQSHNQGTWLFQPDALGGGGQ